MNVTVYPIKISKLLKRFKKKPELEFICHAAEQIFKKKTGNAHSLAVSMSTHRELHRIVPDYIIENPGRCSILTEWTRDLPLNLAHLKYANDREFRIEFLTFVLEQVGDEKIKFEFHHD